jgi:hypothetical protein
MATWIMAMAAAIQIAHLFPSFGHDIRSRPLPKSFFILKTRLLLTPTSSQILGWFGTYYAELLTNELPGSKQIRLCHFAAGCLKAVRD